MRERIGNDDPVHTTKGHAVRRARLTLVLGGVAVVMGLAGAAPAWAKLPAPTTLGGAANGAPVVFVDPRGTVNVLWTVLDRNNLARTRYARKPAGAKRFTTVALPGMPSTNGHFIYAPKSGSLEVIVTVNGPLDLAAWSSSNDGVSWSQLPTTPLMKWEGDGLFLQAGLLRPAPGGPIQYAGSDGATGPIVQLDPSLSQATTIATDTSALIVTRLAQATNGTTFILGPAADSYRVPGTFPFQAGSHTGQVSFPCDATHATTGTSVAMSAGSSQAVVAFAGCGKVWPRTISSTGVVGPPVAGGRSPSSAGFYRNGDPWVDVVGSGGGFTTAFTVPGDDVQVARSSNGSHWSLARGLVPDIIGAQNVGTARVLSTGTASWLGFTAQSGNQTYRTDVIPLSDTYRQPSPPRGSGIKAVLGSTAVTVPGRIPHGGFGRTGKTTIGLIDTFGGKVTVSITVTRPTKTTTYELCSGTTATRLAAGKAKTLTVPCGSGTIVIGGGGGVSTGVAVKKGDVVAFTITGRNGPLVVNAKIS
jgi:hypothetical protein